MKSPPRSAKALPGVVTVKNHPGSNTRASGATTEATSDATALTSCKFAVLCPSNTYENIRCGIVNEELTYQRSLPYRRQSNLTITSAATEAISATATDSISRAAT